MANYRGRMVNYTPRMTDMEAFDLCHPTVKHALETAPFDWNAYSALRYQRKHGAAATVKWIEGGNLAEVKKAWFRGFANPCVTLGIKPLKPTYAAAQ